METDNVKTSIDKNDIIYVMPAHEPKEEIDLVEIFKLLWKGKYILIILVLASAIIGGVLAMVSQDAPKHYHGRAIIKVGEYLVSGGVQQVIDAEELLYRFGNLKPVNTVLNKKEQAEGFVRVNISGSKDFVKKTGDQTINKVMAYLAKREQSLSEHWETLISPSQVLWPLKITQVKQKARSYLIITSMILLGLVIGVIIILIKHSVMKNNQ